MTATALTPTEEAIAHLSSLPDQTLIDLADRHRRERDGYWCYDFTLTGGGTRTYFADRVEEPTAGRPEWRLYADGHLTAAIKDIEVRRFHATHRDPR